MVKPKLPRDQLVNLFVQFSDNNDTTNSSKINEWSDELQQEAVKNLLINESSRHLFSCLHKLLDTF